MVGKKKAAMLLCTVLVGGILAGCGKSATDSNNGGSSSSAVKNIGVIQLVQHDALDASNKGFVDGLKEKGYEEGKNIKIEQQNAQGEQANAQTIAKQFTDAKKDLIFAIATPAVQAAYNSTKDIPIIFTAVTDPVKAEVAKDWKSSGTNVTGTSDKVPVDKQIELLKKLLPNAKTVGVIYNTSETNSVTQVDELKAAADKQGLAVKEIGVTNVNEINQNLASALGQIDVLYTPTDNTVASGYALVGKLCLDKNVPIIGAEEAVVNKGGLASIGIDYYKLGKEAGYKAAEVLDGKKPSDVEISTLSDMSFTINTDVVKKLNITLPADIESNCKKVTGGVE
ncbi:ABC transporter substrate-binding protein [Clostridium beijerinckii]|uniref:ABC transport system substrate-binding protein n=2 Tax=Clostridium beijerinckii TaxID=1520 RepID=A0A9Q5D6D8_CLOBE|nr:ABC transporter substrate-binding protein [Clostridium beijerinckii]AQS03683.1 ABC transporter substrate binding protein [Clostridium beijerinckii]MBA2887440.1 putative ABC transport system substrate-binding protein [Clostridium beijerinckii]MBA2902330.1 putative ABC transport system substrate-binding protein [Clostridium beijerinckii]MBA2912153.1 putative ABC transport system substrate-binding protein [Clostridium beijerinckii]MBA9016772.1 putative ABC transport system substrate-binding pr